MRHYGLVSGAASEQGRAMNTPPRWISFQGGPSHRSGERVIRSGALSTDDGQPDRAARDLLLGAGPRIRSGPFDGGDTSVDTACRLVLDLHYSLLGIQGPPGAGKTHTAARMICALVRAGRRVGVTAVSHKVIQNLLEAVEEAGVEIGLTVSIGHRGGDEPDGGPIFVFGDNESALGVLRNGEVAVMGGTPWLWSRAEFVGAVDVLFVDEAGQMSLANAVAVSPAARSLVLLGDPQQLEQPSQGSHPDGVDASALEHLLGGAGTMPRERGLFLPVTWRLAPAICDYTSEVFYDGKLSPAADLDRQEVITAGELGGAGLRLFTIEHDGNQNASDEEVDAVETLVSRLTTPGTRWRDRDGQEQQVTGANILVVAPYNAQVSRLQARLSSLGVSVGTVDKFQGREAPVVIYSMATSRPEDAPRGLEFLYSMNRLNVATSRARCLAILVANARLFEPECRSPHQMRLANALCRFRELASLAVAGVAESC